MSYTIEQGKEAGLIQANVKPIPLLLCQITAENGDTVYLCTTPALGQSSLTYNGHAYQAKLNSNVIDQVQAMSPQGDDIPGSIAVEIADGNFTIWANHVAPNGWRGGTLLATFVLYDAPSGLFSTNAYSWTFDLDKPDIDANGKLTVVGKARQGMTRQSVPSTARQNRCGNRMPATAEQRYDGLHNPTSPYWGCGYSADQAGGIGNTTTPNLTNPDGSALTDSAGIYVMCDYTRSCGNGKARRTQGCMARLGDYSGTQAKDGDISHDSSARRTDRFDGDTLVWPLQWKGKQYVNPGAGTQTGFNTPNPATGTTYYPEGCGTQWVTAQVLAPVRDPNSYRTEAVVCVALNGGATIQKVVVAGVELTQNNSDVLFTYYVRSAGGRQGAVNPDSSYYKSQGDPHGGKCYIEIVVPVELLANGIADVQVLVSFPRVLHAYPIDTAVISGGNTILTLPAGIRNNFFQGIVGGQAFYLCGNSTVPDGGYTAASVTSGPPGTITIPGTWAGTGGAVFYYPTAVADDGYLDLGYMAENPVWALMDRMCSGDFTAADFVRHIRSWYDASLVCAEQIAYLDLNGNTATHARYRCSYVLEDSNRQSLAKAVLGIRNCAGIILIRDAATGSMGCFIEQTLADGQPSPIAGSNYNTPVASINADGSAATGYLGYLFDGAGTIEKGTFKVGGRSINDSPSILSFPFQDSANGYVKDSITEIDEQAYVASGNEKVTQQLEMLGVENFDQATRRANVEFAKIHYGNTRGDGKGTEIFSFRATTQAIHLLPKPGTICGITYEQLGFLMVLGRLLSAKPTTDGEHIDLECRYHSDIWHTDAYAQNPSPWQRNPLTTGQGGPPLPWRPNVITWDAADALFGGKLSFGLAANTSNSPPTLDISAYIPANIAPQGDRPQTPPLAGSNPTGGYLTAGTRLVMISAGPAGPVSYSIRSFIPAGTTTNTIEITGVAWTSAAPGPIDVYVGSDSQHMIKILSGCWTGSSVDTFGNPTAFSITGTTFGGFPPPGLNPDGPGLPDVNFSALLLQAKPILVGGVWEAVLTHKGVSGGGVTLKFAGAAWTTNQWANYVLADYSLPVGLGAVDRNWIVLSNTADTLTVDGSAYANYPSDGDYCVLRPAAGNISATTIGDSHFINSTRPSGLTVNAFAGAQVRIVSGTGTGQRPIPIASNTSSVVTLVREWYITPDGTSRWIIEAANWPWSQHTDVLHNDGTLGQIALGSIPIPSFRGGSLLVEAVAVDVNDNWSIEMYAPIREIYVPAQVVPGASIDPGYFSITPSAGNAAIDLANGINQRLELNATDVTILAPTFTGGTIAAGASFTLYLDQDSTGGRACPTFTGGTGGGGFVSNTSLLMAGVTSTGAQVVVDGTASTRTSLVFTFHGTYWSLDSQNTAIALS